MEVSELIQREGLRRGLRAETLKTYIYTVNKFLRTYRKQPHEITKEDIENHLIQLIRWNRSGSTLNVHLHALKFFYEQVLGKRLTINLPHIKVRKRLPEFLSQAEMSRFLHVLDNTKHKLILILTYGSGFRVSEVISLKVKDLDCQRPPVKDGGHDGREAQPATPSLQVVFEHTGIPPVNPLVEYPVFPTGYGWIRNGKGGKDRLFIIPTKLKADLEDWIRSQNLKPDDWLFPGYRNHHYSDSSVRKILEEARQLAQLPKHITPHSLRHSFANHLLENGYSLIEVKELLGHSRLETTMIYTHTAFPKLTTVKSPYDCLESKEVK